MSADETTQSMQQELELARLRDEKFFMKAMYLHEYNNMVIEVKEMLSFEPCKKQILSYLESF